MEPGVSIDIMSLRPKTITTRQQVREQKKAETEADLRAKAEDLAFGFSDTAGRFRGIVENLLVARTLDLIKNDPEASGYQKIIRDMGHRFNVAKKAVDQLYQAHLRVESRPERPVDSG